MLTGLLVQENVDVGSVGKIVDCVNSLKSYHERKHCGGTNGSFKFMKSPLAPRSAVHAQSENLALGSSTPKMCLDMTVTDSEGHSFQNGGPNMEGLWYTYLCVLCASCLIFQANDQSSHWIDACFR
jgi:kinesin family protein C2/C3